MKPYLIFSLLILLLLGGCIGADNVDPTPPPITADPEPTILTIADVLADASEDIASVTWITNLNSDSLVRYGTESGKYTFSVGDREQVTSHIITLTEIEPGTTYYYRVSSVDPSGIASQSAEHSFSTIFIPPPKIDNVITLPGSTTALIQWTTDVRSTGVVIYGNSPGDFKESLASTGFSTAHEALIQNLLPGNTYFFKIMSKNEKGVSADTNEFNFETEPVVTGGEVILGNLSVRIEGVEEYFHNEKFYSKANIDLENKADEIISIESISTAVLSDDGNQSTRMRLGLPDEFTSLDLLLPRGTISRTLFYERVAEGPGILYISLNLPTEKYSFKVFVNSPPWTPLNLTVEEEREETRENIEVVLDEFTSRWERHSSGRSYLHSRADFTFTNNGDLPVYIRLDPKPAIIDDEGIQHIYEKTGHKDEFKELTLFPGGQVSGAFFFSPHIGFHTKDIVLILYLNGIKYEYALNVYMIK
ncbi:MAG: fibronectin type III domain-containing protein [Candidatus Hodarchaeales archaeon]|jgi:hypothetical protein